MISKVSAKASRASSGRLAGRWVTLSFIGIGLGGGIMGVGAMQKLGLFTLSFVVGVAILAVSGVVGGAAVETLRWRSLGLDLRAGDDEVDLRTGDGR